MAKRRKLPVVAAVPVVITTGLPVANLEWAVSLGAAACFHKPLAVEALLDEIRRLCAIKRPQRGPYFQQIEVNLPLSPDQFRGQVVVPVGEALAREGLGRVLDTDLMGNAGQGPYELALGSY